MSEFVFSLLVRGIILLAVVMTARFLLNRYSAASKDFVFRVTMIALVALPLLWLAPPAWTWHSAPMVDDPTLGALQALDPPLPEDLALGTVSAPPIVEPTAKVGNPKLATVLVTILALVWACSFLAVLAHFCMGVWRVRRLEKSCSIVDDPSWLKAIVSTSEVLGLGRPVVLKSGNDVPMPFVTGFFRIRLILPESALAFSDENRSMLLCHELT
jgi:hypothetical protein